jgi:hypothetical protein
MPVSSTTTSPKKLAAAYEAGHAQGVKEDRPLARVSSLALPTQGPPAGPETPAEPDGYVTIE